MSDVQTYEPGHSGMYEIANGVGSYVKTFDYAALEQEVARLKGAHESLIELEQWLRKEAQDRMDKAKSRRSYAEIGATLDGADRAVAHGIAEQMIGRKLPKTTKAQDQQSAKVQKSIASRLETEATMLTRFADALLASRREKGCVRTADAGKGEGK